ncbi:MULTISPECIES: regulatory protein GemA [Moraxella]|jgi:hypothetical protein|uniref:Mu-like prophage protein gp16 n=1 Tax=Moraxella lacunata TaxID=477 RepID=A0A1B8Q4Y6_MORLA|nr:MULTISPECIES: regulatory protein GemA [Moraxella]MBE9577881.1 regulatory protein GemA [Moraxella sp. K1664]MBE9587303.1 regulatory protein GemA [Moraxella sp. K1630]MBE9595545.1 regulatory protein GemA [Moraxella sp. K2450]MDI4481920.1 regulatory protein GemA [Moraxella lacunata]MDI4506528.1 regulatory protein GemA [Moraxella lacunata]
MTQNQPKPYDKKKKLIQLIHVGKSELHLDDETYRDILAYTIGKNSTKEMSVAELNIVLTELKRKGFKTTTSTKPKTTTNSPQDRLIRHLWLTLNGLGAVNDRSETAMNNYATNQLGANLPNLNTREKSQLIESLKQWLARIRQAQQ